MKKKLSLQSTNYDSWLWPKKAAQRPQKIHIAFGRARGATDEDLKLLDGDAEAKLWPMGFLEGTWVMVICTWLVLSDEQMSKGLQFSLLNDEEMVGGQSLFEESCV